MQNIMMEAMFTVLAAIVGMESGVLFVHAMLWIRATLCSGLFGHESFSYVGSLFLPQENHCS